jgi:hypothetical protein
VIKVPRGEKLALTFRKDGFLGAQRVADGDGEIKVRLVPKQSDGDEGDKPAPVAARPEARPPAAKPEPKAVAEKPAPKPEHHHKPKKPRDDQPLLLTPTF